MQGLPYTFVYIDNILIASPTNKQHLLDDEKVLCRLQVISPNKCEFGKSTVHFLGHVVWSQADPLSLEQSSSSRSPQPASALSFFLQEADSSAA